MIDLPDDYRVDLEAFCGPLDLLLYLIKEAEVDIYDIPIATITEQYTEYLEVIRLIDLGKAGEFLEMAATLLEIKSKSILPREVVDFDEIEDPRSDLIRQLLEYRRFKGLAEKLEARAAERARRFARGKVEKLERSAEEIPLEEVSLWDLVKAFSTVLNEIGADSETQIVSDETPVRTYMGHILNRLRGLAEGGAVSLLDLFREKKTRVERIGLFLALLELMRLRQVRAEQSDDFAEIQIALA